MSTGTAFVRHRVAALAAAALALLPMTQARAQFIDVEWSPTGEFERTVSVAPGKFAEICGALQKGQAVAWRFGSSHELDFNIHFHEGAGVRYPARADRVRESQGTLAVDSAQDDCWMRSNKAAAAVSLSVELQRR
jgi:hypothetical protein